MAQIVDTPAARLHEEAGGARLARHDLAQGVRRAGDRGRLRVHPERGAVAAGAPQIGKGVGIIGKTLIRHGNEKLKQEFLPKIIRGEIEFAVGYSEPQAGSDAANMQLKVRDHGSSGWRSTARRSGPPRRTSPTGTGWARAPTRRPSTTASPVPDPDGPPRLTIQPIWTIGDERTNEVFFDDVFVPDDYVVGELNAASLHLRGARPRALHDVHGRAARAKAWRRWSTGRAGHRDGEPVRSDPRAQPHRAARDRARGGAHAQRRFDRAARRGGADGRVLEYKLFMNESEQARRERRDRPDWAGPGAQLRHGEEPEAPMLERSGFERSYRYTVVDTIGGGDQRDPEEHHRPAQARDRGRRCPRRTSCGCRLPTASAPPAPAGRPSTR
jgi:3-oxocholest-4-en-26-oyl-CoA dehydrogenase alpha subunit